MLQGRCKKRSFFKRFAHLFKKLKEYNIIINALISLEEYDDVSIYTDNFLKDVKRPRRLLDAIREDLNEIYNYKPANMRSISIPCIENNKNDELLTKAILFLNFHILKFFDKGTDIYVRKITKYIMSEIAERRDELESYVGEFMPANFAGVIARYIDWM